MDSPTLDVIALADAVGGRFAAPVADRVGIAKIARPRADRPVLRQRLFQRLDALRDAPVTWVFGPPGAGKTTLASSYLAERSIVHVWYQLDADDADAATFFFYLGLAIRQLTADKVERLPALTPEQVPGLASFTRHYMAAIATRIECPATIVLDNFEQLPAQTVLHDVLRQLAASLPEGLSLMVLSRTEPPPAYARLRLNGTLAVLDAQELELSRDEARLLAIARERGAGPVIDMHRVDQLLLQSAGWVAGFALLLADGTHPDMPGLTPKSQQLLFDYFASELFGRFDSRSRNALLRTALLPTMTVADAERLSADPTVGRVLADLHRQNCFCVQRGRTTLVYEFHSLFRAFLLDRAVALIPADDWRVLQCLAADLLAEAGQADAAVSLYRTARHWEGLGALALREATGLVSAGRHRTLEQWLGDLPGDVLDRSPWLCYWRAVAQLPFEPVLARGLFEQAFEGFRLLDDAAGLYSTWAGAMEAFFYEWRDFTPADRWIAEFDGLRSRHPDFPSRAVELRTYWAMGTLLHRQPQHPLLPAWSRRALALLDVADLDLSVLLAGYLIIWFLWRGETLEAQAVIDRVAPWTSPDMSPMVFILWSCAVGLFHSVQGQTEPCRTAVEAGLTIARQTGLHAFDFLLCAQMARCCLVAGDPVAVQSWMTTMAGNMRCHSHIDGAFYRHLQSHAAAQRGDWQLALDHARAALAMGNESGVPFLQAHCRIDLARALLHRRDKAGWEQHVQAARAIGAAMGSPVLEYLCLETEAMAALQQGACDSDGGGGSASAPLARAVAVSHSMGGATWQMAGPLAAAQMYDQALTGGVEVEHVRRMIRRRCLAPPEPAAAAEVWPWPVRVYTMGRVQVLCGDEPLRSSGKTQHKPLELLKILCALGGQAVNQDRVSDFLWPDTDGDAADQALRTTLHRLRKLLRCDEAVRLEDRHLRFDERYLWVDSLSFERVAHLPAMADATILRRALSRYRGPFLDGESAPWAHAPRERLRTQFIGIVDRLGHLLDKSRDHAGAADNYLRAIEIEPGIESFYRQLMTAYERLDRRSDALAVYQRCRQMLLSRFGVSPAHETQALCRRLMSPV